MAGKYTLLAIVCLLITLANADLQAVNGRIKISTGTTAGCGDTVRFITQQLAGAYEEYKEFLDIEFVPWGRTTRNSEGGLTCQFRERDCFANRYHRCVLDKLRGNQQAQMDFVTCEFTAPRPGFLLGSYDCAAAAGLNLVEVDLCVATPLGDPLDDAAEAASVEPMQVINFVPSIVFNDEINRTLHTEARTRLKSMICLALAEVPGSGVSNCQI